MRRNQSSLLLAIALTGLVAACGSSPPSDGPPASSGSVGRLPDDPVPRPEPKSRYGNGPNYVVFGKHYTVMPSAVGYKERGVASWYGQKFHGRPTSSMEPYDMHQMTAAHKTLPLPTYVRVRNLSNNRTIVVRVNDRGPFVHNRIIDLSYAAAQKLDIVTNGTGLVEVEAITFEPGGNAQPTRQAAPPAPKTTPVKPPTGNPNHIYVQIGAFGSKANADRRLELLRSGGIAAAAVHVDNSVDPPLYRVRMGPIQGVEQYDLLVDELAKLGIADPHIVTD
ncbi:MAG: septal ring lytic transglycosylase RlpA family protein [Woeseiaceae bacterium]